MDIQETGIGVRAYLRAVVDVRGLQRRLGRPSRAELEDLERRGARGERWVPRGTRSRRQRTTRRRGKRRRASRGCGKHALAPFGGFGVRHDAGVVLREPRSCGCASPIARVATSFFWRTEWPLPGFLSGHFTAAASKRIWRLDLLCKKTDKNMYHPSRFDRSRRRRKAPSVASPVVMAATRAAASRAYQRCYFNVRHKLPVVHDVTVKGDDRTRPGLFDKVLAPIYRASSLDELRVRCLEANAVLNAYDIFDKVDILCDAPRGRRRQRSASTVTGSREEQALAEGRRARVPERRGPFPSSQRGLEQRVRVRGEAGRGGTLRRPCGAARASTSPWATRVRVRRRRHRARLPIGSARSSDDDEDGGPRILCGVRRVGGGPARLEYQLVFREIADPTRLASKAIRGTAGLARCRKSAEIAWRVGEGRIERGFADDGEGVLVGRRARPTPCPRCSAAAGQQEIDVAIVAEMPRVRRGARRGCDRGSACTVQRVRRAAPPALGGAHRGVAVRNACRAAVAEAAALRTDTLRENRTLVRSRSGRGGPDWRRAARDLRALADSVRVSLGVGLVFPLPVGNIEVNYVKTARRGGLDRAKEGLQVGLATALAF